MKQATEVFQRYQKELPEFDAKLTQFFIILLALTNWGQVELRSTPVTKVSLEFSQKVFADFSHMSGQFYSLKEILYYAEMVDELAVKRQETPLFNENFDSEFFYNVSNLIDKVARYTKINFAKGQVLFKFLFNHIRFNLVVPLIFEESNSTLIAHQTLHSNEYLHRVVSLLVKEIFPAYLQSEREYELITLHFVSSLHRSPDIFPISLLLLTDERPLATELLVTRMKTIAPFVETIQVKASSQYDAKDKEYYDSVLSTKVLHNDDIKMISIYPDAKELLPLQEYLQNVQVHREVRVREQIIRTPQYDFQKYLLASQMLLSRFAYQNIDNPKLFVETVPTLIDYHKIIISRFENPFIVDDVNRIDRTPIRKLGYDERFIRPIRELKERQLSYQNLLKTIVFVFNYNDSNDEQSVQLQELLATKPLPEVVADVTGLTDQDLISEIVDSTENL